SAGSPRVIVSRSATLSKAFSLHHRSGPRGRFSASPICNTTSASIRLSRCRSCQSAVRILNGAVNTAFRSVKRNAGTANTCGGPGGGGAGGGGGGGTVGTQIAGTPGGVGGRIESAVTSWGTALGVFT